MMIVIWIALYLTIGVGVLWIMLKVLDQACPEIMDKSKEFTIESYNENAKHCMTKRGAEIRWFFVGRALPLFVWPILALIIVISSFIAKIKGEL